MRVYKLNFQTFSVPLNAVFTVCSTFTWLYSLHGHIPSFQSIQPIITSAFHQKKRATYGRITTSQKVAELKQVNNYVKVFLTRFTCSELLLVSSQ